MNESTQELEEASCCTTVLSAYVCKLLYVPDKMGTYCFCLYECSTEGISATSGKCINTLNPRLLTSREVVAWLPTPQPRANTGCHWLTNSANSHPTEKTQQKLIGVAVDGTGYYLFRTKSWIKSGANMTLTIVLSPLLWQF